MPRYAKGRTKASGWIDEEFDYDEPHRVNPEVDDHEAVDTGLILVTGEPIMRLPNPIGFGRDDEW